MITPWFCFLVTPEIAQTLPLCATCSSLNTLWLVTVKPEAACVTLTRPDWLKMPFLCPPVPDLVEALLPCLVLRSEMSLFPPGVRWQFTSTIRRGWPPSKATPHGPSQFILRNWITLVTVRPPDLPDRNAMGHRGIQLRRAGWTDR